MRALAGALLLPSCVVLFASACLYSYAVWHGTRGLRRHLDAAAVVTLAILLYTAAACCVAVYLSG